MMKKKTAKAATAKTATAKTDTGKGRRKVDFSVNVGKGEHTVYLAGSFNDWDPMSKQLTDTKGDGIYRGSVMLLPGEYEYKFVVDGQWCIDEENPCMASNDLGTLNSVRKVEAK